MQSVEIEVIDALGRLATLTPRSPTLDGALPLRAVQGCTPLLEGTSFGLQVQLVHAVKVERTIMGATLRWMRPHETAAGWGLDPEDLRSETPSRSWEKHCASVLVALRARGILSPRWCERLSSGPIFFSRNGFRMSTLSLWTGLLVRPPAGLALALHRGANRRPLGVTARTTVITDSSGWTPLALELELDPALREVTLVGELATLSVYDPAVELSRVSLENRNESRDFLNFYDQRYFNDKRGGAITKKYRRTVTATATTDSDTQGALTLLDGIASELTDAPPVCVEGPDANARSITVAGRVTVRNAVAFSALYDGQTVSLTWDHAALAHRRARIEAQWKWATEAEPERHRGALWYLTKYFTPHPAGEPFAFVKPASLVVTPPGWSTLIDGHAGHGYDLLRGLVQTDWFHATPAVFTFTHPGTRVHLDAGQPLTTLWPLPRSLASPTVRAQTFSMA